MSGTQIEELAALRAVVGYLGERDQYGWWPSSFFAPHSPAFLNPVFPRTLFPAQCHGVTQAACLVHDQYIGVGRAYHLFRLPEEMEQGMHRALHNAGLAARLAAPLASKEAALDYLRRQGADALPKRGQGPTLAGDTRALYDPACWRTVAAYYARGLDEGCRVFPYFADEA